MSAAEFKSTHPARSHFKRVYRPFGSVLQHKSAPVWIVHYPATSATAEHWSAYRAVEHVRAGRDPWSVVNRSLQKDGFRTLDAALEAAVAVAEAVPA